MAQAKTCRPALHTSPGVNRHRSTAQGVSQKTSIPVFQYSSIGQYRERISMKRTNTRSQQTAVLADRQTSTLIVPPGGDDVTTDGLEMDEQPEEDPVLQPPLWLFI